MTGAGRVKYPVAARARVISVDEMAGRAWWNACGSTALARRRKNSGNLAMPWLRNWRALLSVGQVSRATRQLVARAEGEWLGSDYAQCYCRYGDGAVENEEPQIV
jgi:hypothetical protein